MIKGEDSGWVLLYSERKYSRVESCTYIRDNGDKGMDSDFNCNVSTVPCVSSSHGELIFSRLVTRLNGRAPPRLHLICLPRPRINILRFVSYRMLVWCILVFNGPPILFHGKTFVRVPRPGLAENYRINMENPCEEIAINIGPLIWLARVDACLPDPPVVNPYPNKLPMRIGSRQVDRYTFGRSQILFPAPALTSRPMQIRWEPLWGCFWAFPIIITLKSRYLWQLPAYIDPFVQPASMRVSPVSMRLTLHPFNLAQPLFPQNG